MREKFFNALNLALMLNLFFVLACFFWFAVAVVGRSFHATLGLDLWYQLWQPIIQPAIGILMAGAILSGIASWLSKRLSPEQ